VEVWGAHFFDKGFFEKIGFLGELDELI